MSPPKSVLLHIERIFSKFLWGVTEQHQRRVWRSWDRMSFPVRENGLGFRRLQEIFLAYYCKLWWKWRGNLGLWAHYVHQVSWSGSLAKHRLMSVDDIMRTNSRVLVRDGSASFIFDNWMGGGALVDLFDIPYADSLRTLALHDVHIAGSWDLAALSDFLPQEALALVQAHTFTFAATPDVVLWEPSSSGRFSFKSAYEILRPKQFSSPDLQHVWNVAVPLRVSFFCWKFFNNLLPISDVLMHMGFHMASKCLLV